MGQSDMERSRIVGEIVIYLGLVAGTVILGGVIGWNFPLALFGGS